MSTDEIYDYKGWFWDDVTRQLYRWSELKKILREREAVAEKT